MDKAVIMTGFVAFLAGLAIGDAGQRYEIARNCEQFGQFAIKDTVYLCEKKKSSPP